MSNAIQCDKCKKFEVSSFNSCIERKNFNFGDIVQEHHYPAKIDFCQKCTEELLEILKKWFRGKQKGGKK